MTNHTYMAVVTTSSSTIIQTRVIFYLLPLFPDRLSCPVRCSNTKSNLPICASVESQLHKATTRLTQQLAAFWPSWASALPEFVLEPLSSANESTVEVSSFTIMHSHISPFSFPVLMQRWFHCMVSAAYDLAFLWTFWNCNTTTSAHAMTTETNCW